MSAALLYALHSGNLYGTERMALATLAGLQDCFEPVLFAPAGPALEEAQRLGFATAAFANPRQFAGRLRPYLAVHRQVAFFATGVMHSLIFLAWNAWYRRPNVHIHMVHGGTDERDSYGRKQRLNGTGVIFVAVSEFVRQRLLAHGVRDRQVRVIENFLPDQQIEAASRRAVFTTPGIEQAVIVSRIDPIKRVDLVLDTLDRHPELRALSFRVLGTGWDLEKLRDRAAATHPNVTFVGFTHDVPEELAAADLLLHLCPSEPFGLAILEAMAAGIPVLVPDSGGAGALVEEGVSGCRFRANDADDLAVRLQALRRATPDQLNRLVAGGRQALATRFSETARLQDYRQLLTGLTHD